MGTRTVSAPDEEQRDHMNYCRKSYQRSGVRFYWLYRDQDGDLHSGIESSLRAAQDAARLWGFTDTSILTERG